MSDRCSEEQAAWVKVAAAVREKLEGDAATLAGCRMSLVELKEFIDCVWSAMDLGVFAATFDAAVRKRIKKADKEKWE
jgi:hypothetical protein